MSRGLYQVVSQWGGGGVLARQGWLYRPPPVQVWELAAASLHVARCLRSELSVVCIFCMWSSQLRCRQSHFALGPLFWDIRCKVSAVVPWASETRQRTKEKEVRLFIQILFFFFGMCWSAHGLFVPLLRLLSRFRGVRLCATPQTAAHQAPPSLGFSRQEHWSGCHCLLLPGIN